MINYCHLCVEQSTKTPQGICEVGPTEEEESTTETLPTKKLSLRRQHKYKMQNLTLSLSAKILFIHFLSLEVLFYQNALEPTCWTKKT